jgi:hypothetical protein
MDGWRTQLLCRGLGLALAFRPLLVSLPSGAIFTHPVSYLLVHLSALLLVVFGARLLVLAAGALSVSVYTAALILDPTPNDRRYVEWIVVAVLLTFATLLAWLHRSRTDDNPARDRTLDSSLVTLFRVGTITTLFFVTIHKVNRDFLDPHTSCVGYVFDRFLAGWPSLEPLLAHVNPWSAIAVETSMLVLLLLWPPLGMVITTAVLSVFGLTGYTQIAMVVTVLAFSFLRVRDAEVLRPRLGWLLGGIAAAWAVLFLVSLRTYVGKYSWGVLAAFELFLVAALLTAGTLLVHDVRTFLARTSRGRPGEVAAVEPMPTVDKLVIGTALVVLLVNGLSPYLGLKYEYSLAMFSNLRADTVRWNSLVFPAWLRIGDRDPFVHVRRVLAETQATHLQSASDPAREMGLAEFLELVEKARAKRVEWLALAFRYRGTEHTFERNAWASRRFVDVVREMLRQREAGAGISKVTLRQFSSEPKFEMEPALYAPRFFAEKIDTAGRGLASLELELEYQGQAYAFENAIGDPRFEALMDRVRPDRPQLFQDELVIDGPQHCLH